MRSLLQRRASLGLVALFVAVAAGCDRYIDPVFPRVDVTEDVVYANPPKLVGTGGARLELDIFRPADDAARSRPAIIWVHGGSFRGGTKADTYDLAEDYARRGYVTFSINYRVDPGNRCHEVQDGTANEAETARCVRVVLAAQHDAQAAVRWVRARADQFRIDPDKIAIAGGSAGAVTAMNVGVRSDDPGNVGGDDRVDSSVQAVLSASGCFYDSSEFGLPGGIDEDDPPVHFLHSTNESAPISCVRENVRELRANDVPVETLIYPGSRHAFGIYRANKDEVDASWTAFLVEHLDLPTPGGT